MDKVIIIDGVDVSECDFLLMRDDNPKCECCHAAGFGVICDCEMWKTCYYKQLQRLKEELRTEKIYSSQIEELDESLQHAKAENEKLIDQNFKISQKYTELEQENEQIKKDYAKLHIDFAKCNEENERLKEQSNNYAIQLGVLAQALENIREICKNSHTSASEDFYRTADKIQAKINEVIGVD